MKHTLFLLTLIVLGSTKCIASKDTSFIGVELKLIRAYMIAYPKANFEESLDWKRYQCDTNTDSVNERKFDVEIIINNRSTRLVFFSSWTCSWSIMFQVNNNYIYKDGHPCDNNWPDIKHIDAGKSLTFNLTLTMSTRFDYSRDVPDNWRNMTVQPTKLGLILVNDIFDPSQPNSLTNGLNDKSLQTTIWSNPLYLLP